MSPSPLKSLRLLNSMNAEYYEAARAAPGEGKLVAYLNVFAPAELFQAMDVVQIYPENHAVFAEARKTSPANVSVAEKAGFRAGLCSYALCDIGYALSGVSPVGGLPKPDLLVTVNSQCNVLTKWFERLSERYRAPLVVIDVPWTGGAGDRAHARAYVSAQLGDLVAQLERLTRRRLDPERLRSVVELSNRTVRAWRRVVDSGRHVPAPVSVFDQFISMAPVVAQRGSQEALTFYEELWADIEGRIQRGEGALPEERFRLYWDSLPLWHELSWLSKLLGSHGANLVSTIYTLPWADNELDPGDPFRTWVEQYVDYFDWHVDRRVELILSLREKFKLNGFIYHLDRSCRMFSTPIPAIRQIVQERTGIPGFLLEADHGDARFCSLERIENGLAAYFENLEPSGK
ncbi:MAG: 2-hydroxyacyl-CoA dehydratase [Deltaproteobacteria bacterium]|nr:2-hydroxyacyl-CoA dehydratase [Deltaproteobacteria bacterium]